MKAFYFLILSILFSSITMFGSQKDSVFVQLLALQCDSLIIANESNPYFAIIDVRTSGEYVPEHLKYGVNIDYYDTNFDSILEGLNKDKIYLIHCLLGRRSGQVFEKMRTMNFTQVYNMIGGINVWNAESLAVTNSIDPFLASYQSSNVEFNELQINESDTIEITLTNKGNGNVSFTSISDLFGTNFSTNFDESHEIAGAREYTFEIYYHPLAEGEDAISFIIESTGGNLEFVLNGHVLSYVGNSISETFIVFPNPVTNQEFYIKNLFNTTEIQLYDCSGKLIRTFKNKNFNCFQLQNITEGIYFIKAFSNNTIYSSKIIVK
ncbi:MAG: T9SS type A sorting domain-containing protein [Salinivirgaceae bacterium]|nr:T9SS type A sorting domain-containing protein [Salinivirgaceae bacterium]